MNINLPHLATRHSPTYEAPQAIQLHILVVGMRLRLSVRRHGLPETPIIWVVDTTTAPTIAQLLEQVNEAIPIESGEWGLEDYAVDVKGSSGVNYECLHFQPVSTVMKEEDEVM
jgi:hypothetical protein